MPRIDGPLLRKAISLPAHNKSCADDGVVSEMLSVHAEGVLDMLAAAFENRILNAKGWTTACTSGKIKARGSMNTHVTRMWIDGTVTNARNARRRRNTSGWLGTL